MSLSFGAPAMAVGAALVVVPILIHLLNRRRYVRVPFAAMHLLRQAYAQRRRRLRAENLLLLVLRCLVVLLAALAMTLPFARSEGVLAALGSGRRDLVLVVDRSGSMGRRVGGARELGELVLERLRQRVERLSDARGDAVTLVTMGASPGLPAPVGAPPSLVLQVLDAGLPPPGGVADMVAAARLVRDRIRSERPGRLDVEIYTDLQAVTWAEPLGSLFGPLFEQGGGSLRVVDVAAALGSPASVGVLSLDITEGRAVAAQPITITAQVRNQADKGHAVVEGTFVLDGTAVRHVQLDLAPRASATVSHSLLVQEPGAHHVTFALEADELPMDDQRTLAFRTSPGVEVLLVDGGAVGSQVPPLSRATGWIELALDPTDGESSASFRPTVLDVRRFEELGDDLLRYDAVILADVGDLTGRAAQALADAVTSGTSLLIFMGERVDPRLLGRTLAPLGLLPAALGEVLGDPSGTGREDYVTLVLPEPAPPALELFADPRLAVLLQVPVLAWVDLRPEPGAEVLASFSDALGSTWPAIVAGRLERGRVLLVATSADTSWSLLPRNPTTWVPLLHELLGDLTREDPAWLNVPLGHSPSVVVDGLPVEVELELPSKALERLDHPEEAPRLGARFRLPLESLPLHEAGAHMLRVRTAGTDSLPLSVPLAALPDAREGDLRRVAPSELARLLEGVPYELGEPPREEGQAGAGSGGSLASAVLWALLAVALAESILARFMGRAR